MLLASSSLFARARPQITLAFSLGGLFSFSSSAKQSATTYLIRTPPASAPREVPTPLVFLSARAWDPRSAAGMRDFAAMFAERGYTCLEIDLARPEGAETAQALMKQYEDELRSHIRLTSIPFAPVLVARAGGALIAQAYIESNPAAGLVMLAPPASNDASTALLPTPLPEFTYEPKFPIAILGTPEEIRTLKGAHRLGREDAAPAHAARSRWRRGGVEWLEVPDTEGEEARNRMEMWLDDIGV